MGTRVKRRGVKRGRFGKIRALKIAHEQCAPDGEPRKQRTFRSSPAKSTSPMELAFKETNGMLREEKRRARRPKISLPRSVSVMRADSIRLTSME